MAGVQPERATWFGHVSGDGNVLLISEAESVKLLRMVSIVREAASDGQLDRVFASPLFIPWRICMLKSDWSEGESLSGNTNDWFILTRSYYISML